MNIHELTALTGETPRQVRYLIAEGLMPPPEGGRSNAYYGEVHVAAIRGYQRLRALGFKPAAIRLLREGRGGPVTLPVAPGLALSIDPALFPSSAEDQPAPCALAKRITELITDILMETSKHGPDTDPAPGDADGS
jgi:DNA-binding transcriptional MerR regulator